MTNEAMTLEDFLVGVKQTSNLRTPDHAARLTDAVLHTLGFNLSGGVKKNLAKALPEELARSLTRGWRLIHFRDRNLTVEAFAKDVALHSGNTDPQYAEMATKAVFHNLKQLIDSDLSRQISRDLSPEVRRLWDSA